MDRIANMLSSIKNAAMAKKPEIEIIYTKQCEEIAKVLKERGFLSNVKVFKPEGKAYKMLNIVLAHEGDEFTLSNAKRVSKPGRRIYSHASDLHKVSAGLGVMVVSTSRGIMSGEEAKRKKLGGEILCEVR